MKKVAIGMSGGVDSSVAAYLLQKQGYEVIGITMLMFGDENSKVVMDAKRVCDKLGINHYVFDVSKEFKEKVIDNFICTYKECMTPNPCIECNKHLKFSYMYQKAKELGADFIATGHYAKIEFNEEYNRYVLKKIDSNKDQSYFLYVIDKDILGSILLPLADFENKEDIRKIALENEIPVANKPDSQEICFIPNDDYVNFLETNSDIKPKEGNIVHENGQILGKHNGLYKYTIGQRKGMGVSYKEPIYVTKLNKETNELIVGSTENLNKKELIATNINLLLVDNIEDGIEVDVKIRYKAQFAKAKLYNLDGNIKVIFEEEVKRVASGQSVVFYVGDIVLGGGIIA